MSAIRVTVLRTAGSVPREAGTSMLVSADTTEGTIGGGALEWEAMRHARAMLAEGRTTGERTVPLGPALGQCCGGSVTLGFRQAETLADTDRAPLWIWGAGHVGRAVTATVAPLPNFAITLIDTAVERFPEEIHGEARIVAVHPDRLVKHAPPEAHHLIMTYSHEIDLALCHALLSHDFASVGLIGSATKWARFRSRLSALGHSNAQISRIACPIGDTTLGKHPQAIAVGVAAALLRSADRETGRQTG
ncbi:xanthine dehydrogenase accessory protein XdhC [Pelagovum pacificum]|uniref:Xanthine dehydrogenase accessory protein XdhC n=1 Tax=Pelagovum pacificum TaxID=2588711 RepID=A0A5C5G908_9RHOB|nr:xanthine dehydrogenase accessory protein XdhC [Pelagovum pacificum]QQA42113.1 xanthine dehydrogenase accessory protein XdhC [Pelagovum pacificum]TNY31201.1 xanthine dehydrogenase accessory protein XdhC [Pelagovum pacificum]